MISGFFLFHDFSLKKILKFFKIVKPITCCNMTGLKEKNKQLLCNFLTPASIAEFLTTGTA